MNSIIIPSRVTILQQELEFEDNTIPFLDILLNVALATLYPHLFTELYKWDYFGTPLKHKINLIRTLTY